MSTALDLELAPVVLDLVETYGQNAVFAEPATRTYNATTGSTSEGSVTSHTHKVTPPEPYEQRWVDGDLIQQDDVRIYIPKSELLFAPYKGMKVTLLSTEVFRIVRVHPIYSGEDIAVYELQLRG